MKRFLWLLPFTVWAILAMSVKDLTYDMLGGVRLDAHTVIKLGDRVSRDILNRIGRYEESKHKATRKYAFEHVTLSNSDIEITVRQEDGWITGIRLTSNKFPITTGFSVGDEFDTVRNYYAGFFLAMGENEVVASYSDGLGTNYFPGYSAALVIDRDDVGKIGSMEFFLVVNDP